MLKITHVLCALVMFGTQSEAFAKMPAGNMNKDTLDTLFKLLSKSPSSSESSNEPHDRPIASLTSPVVFRLFPNGITVPPHVSGLVFKHGKIIGKQYGFSGPYHKLAAAEPDLNTQFSDEPICVIGFEDSLDLSTPTAFAPKGLTLQTAMTPFDPYMPHQGPGFGSYPGDTSPVKGISCSSGMKGAKVSDLKKVFGDYLQSVVPQNEIDSLKKVAAQFSDAPRATIKPVEHKPRQREYIPTLDDYNTCYKIGPPCLIVHDADTGKTTINHE
jgi:hypothetical protein